MGRLGRKKKRARGARFLFFFSLMRIPSGSLCGGESQNNKTAVMLVSQTNRVGVELFSHVNAFFCCNKFA